MWDGVEWTIDSAYPSINGASARVIFNNELHLFNGTNHYKYNGTEWTSVGTRPRNGGVMFVYNGFIYLLGYFGGRNEFYYYDGNSWSGWGDIVTQTSTSSTWTKFDDGRVFIYNDDVYLYANNNILKWDKVSVWSPVDVIPSNNVHDYIVEINDHLICVSGATVYRYENPRATLTFLAGNLLKDNRAFSAINYNNPTQNGWKYSDLRTWLNNDLLTMLPSDLQTAITEVVKLSNVPNSDNSDVSDIVTSNDKVWICSYEEAGVTDSSLAYVFGLGESYSTFTDYTSRARSKVGASSGTRYWVRNLASFQNQYQINYDGQVKGSAALCTNTATAVLPGFCI